MCTGAILLLRLAQNRILANEVPFLPFVLAVVLSAYINGAGSGLVATGLGAIAGAFLLLRGPALPSSFVPIHVFIFLLVGGFISWLSERMHRALAAKQAQSDALFRAERERELLLENERAARAEAERASRLKDDFLASVSHELRTPLNAIIGWAYLLMKPGTTDAQRDKAAMVINRNAHLQAQLISDLLDVSRIISGKLQLSERAIDLAHVMEAAVDALRADAAAKRLDLHLTTEPLGSPLTGDPDRLQQVVSNLVSNAIKFTPPGGRIDVALSCERGRAVLMVRDTGQGIAPEFLPHVFDRFWQADASAARLHGGLGLGLSLVKHLTELHGGEVRAESDGVGKGATFWLALPLEAGRSQGRHRAEEAAAAPPRLGGVRVLMVEDNADAREFAQRVLEEQDAEVTTVATAEDALRAMRALAPDVLVSDLGLPGMDGYALVRTIRAGAVDGMNDVPALALTAFARSDDRARALDAGYQEHLAKPIEPATLVAAVARLSHCARTPG